MMLANYMVKYSLECVPAANQVHLSMHYKEVSYVSLFPGGWGPINWGLFSSSEITWHDDKDCDPTFDLVCSVTIVHHFRDKERTLKCFWNYQVGNSHLCFWGWDHGLLSNRVTGHSIQVVQQAKAKISSHHGDLVSIRHQRVKNRQEGQAWAFVITRIRLIVCLHRTQPWLGTKL